MSINAADKMLALVTPEYPHEHVEQEGSII